MLKRHFVLFLPILLLAQAPKVTVTTRQSLGAPLSFTQADKNFTDLAAAANASQRAWGQKTSATTGLTFGYYGGPAFNGTTWVSVADGTVALTASATNYVERTAAGVVTRNAVGWTAGLIPMATVVTGGSSIASSLDFRASSPASGIPYLATLSGAVATTAQEVSMRRISVRDFGAVGDGVTDDTAAIEKAFNALTNLTELNFEPNKTYLVSYVWAPNTDSIPSEPSIGAGRGRSIGNLVDKSFITIKGNGATIKCVNHDIAANGGFRFLTIIRSPSVTVDGLRFDMSFTGYKDDAAFYPMCGGILAADVSSGTGVQSAICSNFTARNLRFKLYHPNGAFAITSHPYGGDNNNGFKVISVFAGGDTSATSYANQHRNLLFENILFEDGHNGYGSWFYAYNNVIIKAIRAEAWVAASYTIAGGTYTGVSFIAPVRIYQYYCTGLDVGGVFVRSLPSASRTGAFQGVCGGISAFSGVNTITTGGINIHDCEFILDGPSPALGSNSDTAIQSDLLGENSVSNCKFKAHTNAGVASIVIMSYDNSTGKSVWEVRGNQTDTNVNGPFVQVVSGSNTAAANRVIKALTVEGNQIRGFGGESAVYIYRTGYTHYGVESLIISKNLVDGRLSSGTVTAVDVRTTSASDNYTITDNIIYAPIAYNVGTVIAQAGLVVRDNRVVGATSSSALNANINIQTGNYLTWATFTAAQSVNITVAVGDYYEYTVIEYDGTGLVKFFKTGIANSGTGTIRTVGAGNTAQLSYKKIGSLR